MGAPTSFTEVEKLNKLIKEYANVKYQTEEISPNLAYMSGTTILGKSSQTLFLDDSVRQAITEAGQKRLAELVKELEEYGIIQLI